MLILADFDLYDRDGNHMGTARESGSRYEGYGGGEPSPLEEGLVISFGSVFMGFLVACGVFFVECKLPDAFFDSLGLGLKFLIGHLILIWIIATVYFIRQHKNRRG